jgi:hypothetical protein
MILESSNIYNFIKIWIEFSLYKNYTQDFISLKKTTITAINIFLYSIITSSHENARARAHTHIYTCKMNIK